MYKEKKYPIQTSKALEYVTDNLQRLNLLCDMTLKYTPFELGQFYAIAIDGISKKSIHEFKYSNNSKCTKEPIVNYIHDKFLQMDKGVCISDEYDVTYEFQKKKAHFKEVGLHYNEEVYYAVKRDELSKTKLDTCLKHGDSIWHSLTVLSDIPLIKNRDQSISEKDIIEIAKRADLVILLAYDGEGYIIWERN